jgi:hypothetical protein
MTADQEKIAQLQRENDSLRHIVDNPDVIVEFASSPLSNEQVRLLSLLNHWQGRARRAEAWLLEYADRCEEAGWLTLALEARGRAK